MANAAEPRDCYQLPVDPPHTLAIKEYGCKTGIPAVFLHGGPGSGCRPSLCRLFDLDRFRVIAPDQRGAGESTPQGALEQNTTWHLVEDLELIRRRAGIERWLVVGGSWGALLAVAYAETHPQAVAGIVLRSLFLGTEEELQQAFIKLPQAFYPDLYRAFVALLPEAERQDPLKSCYRRILASDPQVSLPAARTWHNYERALSALEPSLPALPDGLSQWPDLNRPAPATPRMEAHYFSNRCFLEPGRLLKHAPRLAAVRGVIVQSRYDLLCPPANAHRLSRHWPAGKVVVVEAAGHSQSEPGVEKALREAVGSFAGT